METENVVTTPAVEAVDPAEKRNPKIKKRTVEVLADVQPNKMTDAEKIDYIKHLREQNNLLAQQAYAYAQNAEKAYDQFRNVNKAFEDYKLKAQACMNYAQQCVDHCRTSIRLSLKNMED